MFVKFGGLVSTSQSRRMSQKGRKWSESETERQGVPNGVAWVAWAGDYIIW